MGANKHGGAREGAGRPRSTEYRCVVAITMPIETLQKVDEKAADEIRSRSFTINEIVAEYFSRKRSH